MIIKRLRSILLDNFLYKISIRDKLIFYFLISILIPTMVLTAFIYTRSKDIITKKTNVSISLNLNSAKLIIEQKIDSINAVSTMISLNPMIQTILSSPQPEDNDAIISEIVYLKNALNSYYLANYTTMTNTTLIPKMYMLNRPKYMQFSSTNPILDIGLVNQEPWYAGLTGKSTYVGVENISDSSRNVRALKMVKKLYGLNEADKVDLFAALLTIDIDTTYFDGILAAYKITPGSSVLVLDGDGKVILSSDSKLLDINLVDAGYNVILHDTGLEYSYHIQKISGKEILVSYNRIEPLLWTVVNLSPMAEVSQEQSTLNRITLFAILGCMLFALFIALLLAANITKPIHKLVKSMSNIQDGNFEIQIEYKQKDEFSFLIAQYKKMMREIGELIDRLYTSEVNKKNAELKAKEAELQVLQAQINPHFLYNALDSINMYSMKYKIPVIGQMINSLSNFFRYGLNNGRWVVTLDDEKKHVESYLEICKQRYGKKLNYSISIPAEISSCLTVKFILQPLVENAIIHGIQMIQGNGMIKITAERTDETIRIHVSDNGAGTDVNELNEVLNTRNEQYKSFGIKNVNDRIKHLFGSDYGLTYSENEGGGITATVCIPALKTMEGYHAKDDSGR